MGKKRKQDQWRDDTSSSDIKRRRSCHRQNGETSRPNDWMPPQEGLSDISLGDTLIKLIGIIQVKLSTDEKFKRKIQKLKEKRKKDKNKHEEDLRLLKEDLRKLKEDHEELKLQIQEMRKEECAEVNHYKSSQSQRSQLSQSTRFRLVIETSVGRTIYKKETVETEDGGGHIKVVMYDGGNPIAYDHRLASVRVELVVIEGGFDEMRDSWSKEEFEKSIIKPRRTTTLTSLVKNGTFNLIGGSCDHQGAIIMDNSQQREVKLGVRITVPTETRVLEGVSNPFKVQEGKTKKSAANKTGKKPSPPVPTQNLVRPTSTHATQHGNNRLSYPPVEGNGTAEDNRLSYPLVTVPQRVQGNGQALNGNSQQSSQQIPTTSLWQSTSTHSMQHEQGCSLPQPSMQNPLKVAGNYTVSHHLLASGQDQYNNFPNASSPLAFLNNHLLNNIPQWNPIPGEEIFGEGVNHSNIQPPVEEYYVDASFRCNQVLLQWDEPHVELKKHCNFLDQLMPLYSTQSGFYRESFPGTSVMDKTHELLASISSGDSVLKMIMGLESRATQTHQRRGVLIRPIEPYDSDDGPPVKKQMNAKYQLRFVNRVCNVYYTREQIKSEDGNLLKIALYDEDNLVVTSGPLSSASVKIILLHGDFNAEGQDYWTLEEFSACLVHPQSVKEPPALGGDSVLALTDGEADLANVNFQTSSVHARTGKFKMGVEIINVREDNVQEGITSPFHVRVRQGEDLGEMEAKDVVAPLAATTDTAPTAPAPAPVSQAKPSAQPQPHTQPPPIASMLPPPHPFAHHHQQQQQPPACSANLAAPMPGSGMQLSFDKMVGKPPGEQHPHQHQHPRPHQHQHHAPPPPSSNVLGVGNLMRKKRGRPRNYAPGSMALPLIAPLSSASGGAAPPRPPSQQQGFSISSPSVKAGEFVLPADEATDGSVFISSSATPVQPQFFLRSPASDANYSDEELTMETSGKLIAWLN